MEFLPDGTITSAPGFRAGATYAGLKALGENKLDLGLLYAEQPCAAAGVFTTNKVIAAPLLVDQEHLQGGRTQALVVNSGIANACTGDQGLKDARDMAAAAAQRLGLKPTETLVASTGVIGVELPMGLIRTGLRKIELAPDAQAGHRLARAIMTTDTVPKEGAVAVEVAGHRVTLGGIAKGSGMIAPAMATMLAFLATDAAVEPTFLRAALRRAVDASFNQVTVDMDTSTNDMVLIYANGLAGNPPLRAGAPGAENFEAALTELSIHLAKLVARDGEGSTKLLEVRVEGARSLEDARRAALTIAGSPLVKTAAYGNDPNWGRVLAALGRSGAEIELSKVTLYINEICMMDAGAPVPFYKDAAVIALKQPEVVIHLRLNLGEHSAMAWGCDLTEGYVQINARYTT
ncbi:MAG: bifunctional glutamate N-acetyltransferase/amino-acid acetyltransferase ArgJ [Chloroflexi bacterium]|nr:bifunctional glutamate N-acetyltransferase/amino-acid acetyltransferase ArgJ [Chloroflexota bacterium]